MIDRDIPLTEFLQDAWSFEQRLLQLVEGQLAACRDRAARRLYREHSRLTETQIKRLESRMEALGICPAPDEPWQPRGRFSQRLARLAADLAVADFWRDESVQGLINSYGIKQVECSMYRALLKLAQTTDDEATATLARANLEEEEATARRLLFCIATRGKNADAA
jgi:ferritin-like metal-binding protein YciE